MDKILVNIIILPPLNYFQSLYDYFSFILPYIIHNYLWLLSNFLVIFCYFTLGYFWLF
jgi:hypothetical protein